MFSQTGRRATLCLAMAVLVLAGCAGERPEPSPFSAKPTAEQLVGFLHRRANGAAAFKASGQCRIHYVTQEGDKRMENMPLRLWFEPPAMICLQGSVGLDGKGVVAGANAEEFWLALRPREISSFYWGRWSGTQYEQDLLLNPRALLEAVGLAAAEGDTENGYTCTLSRRTRFDVLEYHRLDGTVAKRLYVDSRGYRVRKIEYFDPQGLLIGTSQADKYHRFEQGVVVPSQVRIETYARGRVRESVRVLVESVTPAQFTDKQREILFTRPQAEGFNEVFEYVDGNWIRTSGN